MGTTINRRVGVSRRCNAQTRASGMNRLIQSVPRMHGCVWTTHPPTGWSDARAGTKSIRQAHESETTHNNKNNNSNNHHHTTTAARNNNNLNLSLSQARPYLVNTDAAGGANKAVAVRHQVFSEDVELHTDVVEADGLGDVEGEHALGRGPPGGVFSPDRVCAAPTRGDLRSVTGQRRPACLAHAISQRFAARRAPFLARAWSPVHDVK